MVSQRGTGATLFGIALALSTAIACVPPAARAPIVTEGGAPGGAAAAQQGGAGAAAGAAGAPALPPPRTVAECRGRLPKPPTSFPPNPASDAQEQLDERFQANHESFRCCFDALYAPSAPRVSGHVALLVKLDSMGKLTSAEIVAAETDVASPEVSACVIETARELAFPAPANDMDIAYKRVFDFKARR